MEPRIVGWHLQPNHDLTCDQCRVKPATVLVDLYGKAADLCDECKPKGAHDEIAEIFARVFDKART